MSVCGRFLDLADIWIFHGCETVIVFSLRPSCSRRVRTRGLSLLTSRAAKDCAADILSTSSKPGATAGAMRRTRRGGPAQAFSLSGIVRNLVAWILALDRSAEFRSAAEQSPARASNDRRDTPFVHSAGDQQEFFFEDLPEGFHDDVASITVAVGGHHTCALEYRPGVDFGGPVRCWGRDDWGQSTPSDDIFVQVCTTSCVFGSVVSTAICGSLAVCIGSTQQAVLGAS